MVPLTWYLIVAAALFCIGAFGALARRNAVGVLMGIELMLNAVNINLIAFWRYVGAAGATAAAGANMTGQLFAIFVITVAAAEAAVGLALIIAIYRQRSTVVVEDIDTMKG
jgi:NADH-quinone oxidoreductase subunit K